MLIEWGEAEEDGDTEEQNQGKMLVGCLSLPLTLRFSSIPAESPQYPNPAKWLRNDRDQRPLFQERRV